jgi:hypothetical protein
MNLIRLLLKPPHRPLSEVKTSRSGRSSGAGAAAAGGGWSGHRGRQSADHILELGVTARRRRCASMVRDSLLAATIFMVLVIFRVFFKLASLPCIL